MNSCLRNRFQQGVTLLEVLIAIVVLSFGLLGMLGMLLNGLKMTSSSHYRTIAAQQLTAMADMINAHEKLSANPLLKNAYAPPASSTITASCFTTGCNTAQMPPTDYGLWLANLARLLPNGTGVVCLDATPQDGSSGSSSSFACTGAGRPTVKICWNENARIAISRGGVADTDPASTKLSTCMSTHL